MKYIARALAALLLAGVAAAAVAQADYPRQPIRMVVTFPQSWTPVSGMAVLQIALQTTERSMHQQTWVCFPTWSNQTRT